MTNKEIEENRIFCVYCREPLLSVESNFHLSCKKEIDKWNCANNICGNVDLRIDYREDNNSNIRQIYKKHFCILPDGISFRRGLPVNFGGFIWTAYNYKEIKLEAIVTDPKTKEEFRILLKPMVHTFSTDWIIQRIFFIKSKS